MPSTLAKRLLTIRSAAGYGKERQAAEFARKVGIAPASLHNLESGKTKSIGKSLTGYLKLGANLDYIEKGRGTPMLFKQIERGLETQTLASMFDELDEDQRRLILDMAKNLLRRHAGPSGNDPFKTDPPSGDGTK